MEQKKLNLGSGAYKKAGFINVDWVEDTHPDVVHNLAFFPYPFADSTFDVIEADHVLEHLPDPFGVMRELHRIAAPGALITIRVPHYSRGFTHPEHQRGFDITFPYYFSRSFPGGYQGVEFTLKKLTLTWFAQKYLKKATVSPIAYYGASMLGAVFSFLANLSPMLCSRLWCFWVGGFEQIEFQFTVKK